MFSLVSLIISLSLAQVPAALTVEDACRLYPAQMAHLFDSLDLARPDLQAVKAAADAGDRPKACNALLKHYAESKMAAKLRVERKPASDARDPEGDAILNDLYTLYGVQGKVPRRADGGLDWTCNGPSGDKEWGWGLNRQPWIHTLLSAYSNTGNTLYITSLDALLRDWVATNPYPGVKNSTPQWRGLEVFMRTAANWPAAFFGLQEFPEFSPGTRLLMLSSIPDHAHYNRNHHAAGGNWVTMEMRGLACAAAYYPEFKEADAWFSYAVDRMTPELTAQVYPDGAQKELTVHYHLVAMKSFEEFAALADDTGRSLPSDYTRCVERMLNYAARTMTPSGMSPLNNDSDLDCVQEVVATRADTYGRPDWAGIVTHGAQGVLPEGIPSDFHPWAGQMVMRDGWKADSQWAFFDVGPMGTGHCHLDRLHLSVSAAGRDLLVDGGRYTYQPGAWRKYFTGSASHNTILVDGKGQKPFEKEALGPVEGDHIITPEYDFARGKFSAGYEDVEGAVTHERSVLYVRGKYWVVLDRVSMDRPHEIEALWHFHPECTVALQENAAASTDEGRGNARVAPAAGTVWSVELVRERTEPSLQGWWSRKYNSKEPASCAVYTTRADTTVTFAWLVTVAEGTPRAGKVILERADGEAASVRVEAPGETSRTWRMPFKQGDLKVE